MRSSGCGCSEGGGGGTPQIFQELKGESRKDSTGLRDQMTRVLEWGAPKKRKPCETCNFRLNSNRGGGGGGGGGGVWGGLGGGGGGGLRGDFFC